jgi:cell division septation protein DedD
LEELIPRGVQLVSRDNVYTTTTTITLPAWLTSGVTYYLGMIIDDNSGLAEVDEANNAAFRIIKVNRGRSTPAASGGALPSPEPVLVQAHRTPPGVTENGGRTAGTSAERMPLMGPREPPALRPVGSTESKRG